MAILSSKTHVPRPRIHLSFRGTYSYLLLGSSNFTLAAFVLEKKNIFNSFINMQKELVLVLSYCPLCFETSSFIDITMDLWTN